MVSTPDGYVWDCSGCTLIHEEGVVQKVIELSMSGEPLESVWRKVMEPRACRL